MARRVNAKTQLDIFTKRTRADEAFEKFHSANPEVYNKLVVMARELRDRGHRRIGMQMLFEVLRWRSMMQTRGDLYKLNNNYCSRYARLIMTNEPALVDFFELRQMKT